MKAKEIKSIIKDARAEAKKALYPGVAKLFVKFAQNFLRDGELEKAKNCVETALEYSKRRE